MNLTDNKLYEYIIDDYMTKEYKEIQKMSKIYKFNKEFFEINNINIDDYITIIMKKMRNKLNCLSIYIILTFFKDKYFNKDIFYLYIIWINYIMTDQNKNYFLSLSDNFEYKKIRKFYINYKTDINNKFYDILVKNNNFTNIKTRIIGIKNDLMYRCTMFMVAYNSGIHYNNINSNIKRKSCYNIIIYDINNIIIYVSNSISIYSYESYEKLIIELYNKTNIFLLSFMNSADKIYISLNCKYTDGIYSLNEEKGIEKNHKIENINLISIKKKKL